MAPEWMDPQYDPGSYEEQDDFPATDHQSLDRLQGCPQLPLAQPVCFTSQG